MTFLKKLFEKKRFFGKKFKLFFFDQIKKSVFFFAQNKN